MDEVAFMWAAHQVHHSSEYYNLTTALRQSLTQQFTAWMFYMPLALVIPPSIFAVHIQMNLLYQFWIHTEVIRDLGPLEWIFNTPKHHRVHHGRNLYCIDKNYGGILIIWDRLFGTFAEESDKSFLVWSSPSRLLKFSTFSSTTTSRLGDHVDNPKVTGKEKPYNPSWALTLQLYVVLHFLLVLKAYHDLFEHKMMLSQVTMLGMICYVLLTLTALGFIIDQRPSAGFLEMLRCVVMVTMLRYNMLTPLVPALTVATEVCHNQQHTLSQCLPVPVHALTPGVVCSASDVRWLVLSPTLLRLRLQMHGPIDHKIGVPLALVLRCRRWLTSPSCPLSFWKPLPPSVANSHRLGRFARETERESSPHLCRSGVQTLLKLN
ncbi:hypothetical protein WMY93_026185 [Mugilogobius chulae]|uniref:Alkylglycerol monooxygenase n=1 Tax=Mugilogobius chulae TaxID=88201 RepID=A0AAW0N075_9GOBI